ncbi:hypothetical protein EXE58_09185 [Nocardioides seonyuensis]|uniref:Uncharacterized protein n=1 Tax=Nocardioides seonyuensis TaxID=2518371 RepID=A0A4P7IEM9_9ACTN|nr:hypothetical protein [Nocardioides seonyuensis]QBX55608.1 hypothetical protein EXE58_09185 [Nocardioides seonyuensis]
MSDVVDATFMVPGPGVRRGMRVREFSRGVAIRECGGDPLPVDSTQNRHDQSHFPDLNLIRERGFAEPRATESEDRVLDTLDPSCPDLAPDWRSQGDWLALGETWNDVVMAVDQDPRMDSLRQPVAECLIGSTGRDVDPVDPINSFLRGVDVDTLAKRTSSSQIEQWADAYADCADEYFREFGRLLLEVRPALVEKHREVIEAYAAELVGAGYVP